MFWDKPEYRAYEPQSFKETVTKITYEMTEDDVTKYWYNKGHEDGRKLARVKELTDEDCIIPIWLAKNFLESTDVSRFKRILEEAILRKAKEK